MNKFRLAAFVSLFLGLGFTGLAILTGEVEFYIALIFPVIKTSNPIGLVGFGLIFLSFFLFILSMIGYGDRGTEKTFDKKAGGIIFIGPIPIIFSTDKKLLPYLLVAAIAITVVIILFIIIFQ